MAGISYIFSHTHTQILKERKREREIMRKTEMLTLREKEREREREVMRQKEREVMRKKYCLYVSVRERLRYLHGKKERKKE